MDPEILALFEAREASDESAAYEALVALFRLTEAPVDWAYEAWDRLLDDLTHPDNHRRSFSAQMLSRLAISDPDRRMLRDFGAVARVMHDDRFVTARHTLRSLWRVGLAGPEQRGLVLDALQARFRDRPGEKNASLVRTDVIAALGNLAKAVGEGTVGPVVEALLADEPDAKARAKQKAAWRKALR